MTLLLSLAFSFTALWAQAPADRFSHFCDQIAAPVPVQSTRANVKVGNLMAVVDATNGTDKLMREAVARNLDYEQFKTEMAAKNVVINDQFHQNHYAKAARAKCESIQTESGPGDFSTQAHTSPTREQLGRRVDDSGIGVGPASGSGTTETEQ